MHLETLYLYTQLVDSTSCIAVNIGTAANIMLSLDAVLFEKQPNMKVAILVLLSLFPIKYCFLKISIISPHFSSSIKHLSLHFITSLNLSLMSLAFSFPYNSTPRHTCYFLQPSSGSNSASIHHSHHHHIFFPFI